MKSGYIYILSNEKTKPFYIGVTSNLEERLWKHKNGSFKNSFTLRYKLYKLLYWELVDDIVVAINREKQLKNWHYDWKLNLIKTINPKLKDLSLCPNYLDPETSSG